jgi:hypothetical protein
MEGSSTMSHVYKYAGNYKVSVTVVDDICQDEIAQTLTLVSDKFTATNLPVVTKVNDQFVVNFNFENATSVSIQLVDALGKEVISNINKTVSNDKVSINSNQLSDGIYFVNLKFDNQVQSTKLIK